MRGGFAHRGREEGAGPQPPVWRPEEQTHRHCAELQPAPSQEQTAAGVRGPHHSGGGEENQGSWRSSEQLEGVVGGGSGAGRTSQGGERSPGHQGAEQLLAVASSGPAGQGHRGGFGEGEEGAALVLPAQFQGVRHLRHVLPQSCRAAPEEAGAAGGGYEGPVRSAELDHQQLQEVRE